MGGWCAPAEGRAGCVAQAVRMAHVRRSSTARTTLSAPTSRGVR